MKEELTSLATLKPEVSKAPFLTIARSLFPRPEPIRNVFCCTEIVDTTHKTNEIEDYGAQITYFMDFAKLKHGKEAIPVVDLTWPGLKSVEFILEVKRGTFTPHRARGVATRSQHTTNAPNNGENDNVGAIKWGFGRYLALSDGAAGGFVEVLLNDGKVPDGFENILGLCKELVCEQDCHGGVVYQFEVWESHGTLENGLR